MRSSGLSNTPSLQHALALIGADVTSTIRNFEALEAAKIDFNYRLAGQLFKPLMEGSFTEAQAVGQCNLLKKPRAAHANAGLVSAFAAYALEQKASWFNSYPRDLFPIARGINIPINPAGYFVRDGRLRLVWVQAWKNRTLDPYQRALFYTVLEQRVLVGEDFGSAELDWVDLKAPHPKSERAVAVHNRKDFDIVSERELKEALDVLLEAFLQYIPGRDRRRSEERARREPPGAPLFD